MAERCFRIADKNCNGYLEKNEIGPLIHATLLEAGIDKYPTENEIDSFMEQTDTDGNGKISLEEYTHSINEALNELAPELDI